MAIFLTLFFDHSRVSCCRSPTWLVWLFEALFYTQKVSPNFDPKFLIFVHFWAYFLRGFFIKWYLNLSFFKKWSKKWPSKNDHFWGQKMSNSQIFDIKCWCKFQIINLEGFLQIFQNRISCQASVKKCALTFLILTLKTSFFDIFDDF